ncbi:MAG: 50S ribosomal protein L21 [Planctomycetota bacterium]|jgi:large subunit ribosomal protein L21
MYAVLKDSGRQFTVRKGDRILIDRQGLEEGAQVRFEDVLMVGGEGETRIGTPQLEGAAVVGKVLGAEKGDKIVVFKKRRRKDSKRKNGHRQKYTRRSRSKASRADPWHIRRAAAPAATVGTRTRSIAA